MTTPTDLVALRGIDASSVLNAKSTEPTETLVEDLLPNPETRRYQTIRIVSIVVFFALWEVVGRYVSPTFTSYPSAIALAGFKMAISGELLRALLESGAVLVAGFAAAIVLGILIGMLMGRYRSFEAATDWLVDALYATPLIAVTPLIVLWFGLGFNAKFFIVFIMGVFPIVINTASGVRNIPDAMIDVGRAFAANERQTFAKIILPGSLPYIMTGLRLAIGRCLIGMVVAEFYTAIGGLGALIIKYGSLYNTAGMFVPLIVLCLMGVLLTGMVRAVEDFFAPWKLG